MIREYRETDFSDIERIYNLSKIDEFIGEKFEVPIISLGEDSEMLNLFRASTIFVYEVRGIVGFVGVRGNSITWLFVCPEARGKGIGKKLVLYVMSILSGEVILKVARSNCVAKIMYERLGFKVAKEFTGKYNGNSIEVCQMVITVNALG